MQKFIYQHTGMGEGRLVMKFPCDCVFIDSDILENIDGS